MNIALILAGGTGTRLGAPIPKQYLEIKGKPLFSYTLEVFENHPEIDRIQIVAEESWHNRIRKFAGGKFIGFSVPGDNRQLSILNGLEDILKNASLTDNVIIQDAARPLTKPELITGLLDALKTHEAAAPVLPVKDTVYTYENGRFTGTADRSRLMAGQAPEGFRLGKYLEATKALLPDRILSVTGSLQVALLAGMDAVSIPGDEDNFKITTSEDLKRFSGMLAEED